MEAEPTLDYSAPAGRPVAVGSAPVLTGRQLAALACRVIALWLFAETVQEATAVVYGSVWAAFYGGRGPTAYTGPGLGLLAVAGPVAAGVYLWTRSDRLAARMVPDDTAAVPAGGPGYPGLLSVGLTVTGAAVIVPAVRSLASAAASAVLQHGEFAAWWHDPTWVRQFCSSAAGLALGAWLLFGGRGIANVIVWARTAGGSGTPPPG